MRGGLFTKADGRVVDEPAVAALLQRRSACKARKDFGAADKIATQLQAMGICYLDQTYEWYTKVTDEASASGASGASSGKPKDAKPSAAHLASKKASGIKKKIKKKKATKTKTPNKTEAALMKSIKKSGAKGLIT